MPAVSKSQQQAAGMALAAKRGEMSVSDLKGAAKDMYDSMSEKDLEDFASTSHEGKPERVKQEMNRSQLRQMVKEEVHKVMSEATVKMDTPQARKKALKQMDQAQKWLDTARRAVEQGQPTDFSAIIDGVSNALKRIK